MKKTKWLIVGGIMVALIAVVIILLFFLTKSKDIKIEDAQLLIDAKMQEIFVNFDENESYELDAIKESASITVKRINHDGELISAECKIKSINIGKTLVDLLDEMKNQETDADQYSQKICNAVDSADITETECILTFTNDSDGNLILNDIPYEVYDAYLGGYLTYAQKAIELMGDYIND